MATKSKFNYKWIIAIISIALFFGMYFVTSRENNLGTFTNPKLAFDEFSKSMEMISTKYNKGTYTLGYLDEIENTLSLIFKIHNTK